MGIKNRLDQELYRDDIDSVGNFVRLSQMFLRASRTVNAGLVVVCDVINYWGVMM